MVNENLLNLLSLLALSGWRLPASRTPANNGVPGVGISTSCEPASSRGIPAFIPDSLELVVDVWKDFCSGDGTISSPAGTGSTNPSHSAIHHWGWGFRTLWGGIDPGGRRFRPWCVGIDPCGAISTRGNAVFRGGVGVAPVGNDF